jgi:hypothetical protein
MKIGDRVKTKDVPHIGVIEGSRRNDTEMWVRWHKGYASFEKTENLIVVEGEDETPEALVRF